MQVKILCLTLIFFNALSIAVTGEEGGGGGRKGGCRGRGINLKAGVPPLTKFATIKKMRT